MGHVRLPGSSDLPAMADVVIIGGGIVGVASAFFLSRHGLHAVVIERKSGLGNVTTAASSECFRRQYVLPEHIAMMRENVKMLENFADLIGISGYDIGLHQPGYLILTSEPEGEATFQARVQWQRAHGLSEVELVTPPELQRSFGYVSPLATAATYMPRDGWLSAHELTYGFAKGSQANFLIDTEVQQIVIQGSRVAGVRTDKGEVLPRRGAGSGALLQGFGPVHRHRIALDNLQTE